MFAFIRKFLPKKKVVQTFSTTLTTAEEGSKRQQDMFPEMKALLRRMKKSDKVTNEDLNAIGGFYFNQPTIQPGMYNINKAVLEGMCFDINAISPEYNDQGDVTNVFLTMREVTMNNELIMVVSIKDFHEIFSHLQFPTT